MGTSGPKPEVVLGEGQTDTGVTGVRENRGARRSGSTDGMEAVGEEERVGMEPPCGLREEAEAAACLPCRR